MGPIWKFRKTASIYVQTGELGIKSELTWPRGRVGWPPFSIWCLRQGIGTVFRGLALTFSALVSAFSRLRRFRFFCFKLIAAAVVSYHQFFSFALGVGSSFLRRFRVCVYSCASYSDHSSKLATFYNCAKMSKNTNLTSPVCRVQIAFRIYEGGKRVGRRPSIYRFEGSKLIPP